MNIIDLIQFSFIFWDWRHMTAWGWVSFILSLVILLPILSIVGYKTKQFFTKIYRKKIVRKLQKKQELRRQYLYERKSDNKLLAITDPTPVEYYLNNKLYLLQPLKYRQYKRMCILFANIMQSVTEMSEEDKKDIGKVVAANEDTFFKAFASVLYFSLRPDDDNEYSIREGILEQFEIMRKHATLDDITRLLEIVQAQNDIDGALKAFGLYNKSDNVKKKV
jgi:hypothetical protein